MDASFPGVQSRPMKRISCLAAAAALAASAGLGCQGDGPRKPGASDPPAGPAASAPKPAVPPPPAIPPGPPATAPTAPAATPASPASPAGPPPSKEYAADIEKLCDVVRLAGVEGDRTNDRLLLIANWLAANLTTAESRQFLVRIQPLGDEPKADALDAEARRVGLPGCNLSAEWRSPP